MRESADVPWTREISALHLFVSFMRSKLKDEFLGLE
jgi:hypothetical protein